MALITGAKSHWDATQEGSLGLEDKKTAQKTWTMQKSWSRYYFSMNECQEVSCGSCVFSWELKILPLLSSFSGGLLNEVLLPMASQSAPFPWCWTVLWVTDPQGVDTSCATVTLHGTPWVMQMPECPFLSSLHCPTGLHTPSNQECATVTIKDAVLSSQHPKAQENLLHTKAASRDRIHLILPTHSPTLQGNLQEHHK